MNDKTLNKLIKAAVASELKAVTKPRTRTRAKPMSKLDRLIKATVAADLRAPR